MSCLQATSMQSTRLSSRSVLSRTVPSARLQMPCRARRSQPAAPRAFLRGYCGMPSGFSQANQQVLEQMLQQATGLAARSPYAGECELPLAVDACDEGESYVFVADIPGIQREDLKVQTRDHKLNITGKRQRSGQAAEGKKQRFERTFGKFARQLRLPEDADCNSIKAKVDNGVLTVTISKLAKLPGVEDVQVDF